MIDLDFVGDPEPAVLGKQKICMHYGPLCLASDGALLLIYLGHILNWKCLQEMQSRCNNASKPTVQDSEVRQIQRMEAKQDLQNSGPLPLTRGPVHFQYQTCNQMCRSWTGLLPTNTTTCDDLVKIECTCITNCFSPAEVCTLLSAHLFNTQLSGCTVCAFVMFIYGTNFVYHRILCTVTHVVIILLWLNLYASSVCI